MIPEAKDKVAAMERFKSDRRQFGGLLLFLATMPVIHPLANIAAGITPNSTPTGGVPLWTIIAGLCDVFFGSIGMVIGYLALIHDYHNPKFTFFLLIITQLAYVPYITDMSGVGLATVAGPEGNPFVPPAYNPTETDVRLFGAMGIIGIFSWGFTFLGSLGFSEFALYSYQAGKPEDRDGEYFGGRLRLFASMYTIAGLTQFILGIYALDRFGNGPLPNGPVGVAMYIVNFPEITIFVGLVHLLMGSWGVLRSTCINADENDNSYQFGVLFSWYCTLALQVLVQVSYHAEGPPPGAAPTILPLTFGLHVMPAFLDYKMRTTPMINVDLYGSEAFISGNNDIA